MNPNTLLFPLAKRFVAGTTNSQALSVVHDLHQRGFLTTLDFLGEDITSIADAENTVNAYQSLIEDLRHQPMPTNLSVKLSALGLACDAVGARERLARIQRAAQGLADPFIRVDMERATTVETTLSIMETLFEELPSIGPVLQAYLRRTPGDVERMIARGIRVRLCKGAYSEGPTIAYTSRSDIQREFLRLAEALVMRGHYPGIATHDEQLIDALRRFIKERNIAHHRFEFQMLYGVRPRLQEELVQQGYTVRIYVPFGTHWSGYLRRRIMERRENALFALGALFQR